MFNAIKHRVGISLLSICIMLIICQGVSPLSAFSQEALGPSFEFNPEEVLDKYFLYHDASGNNNIRHVMRKHPVLARASAGGYLFKMVKFKGITAKYGGNLTATLNLDVDTSEIRRLPQYAGMDLRVLNYEPDPEDFAYIQFYNDIGKIETLPLETTSDAAGQISFMLPLTVSQAETIFQSRSGANIPATIFMTKHVLTTNKDLKVNITIQMHEIYKYFSANASVGWWIFKASYKQVRESHNIDRFIDVKTFQGRNATDKQLENAQEEAWNRIREILFKPTVTDKPRPDPPVGGWPPVLAAIKDFYENIKNDLILAGGGGYLTAAVVDITRTRDEKYEYRLDKEKQEIRPVKLDYAIDVSPLAASPNQYYFLIEKFPDKFNINVKTTSGLVENGVYEVLVEVVQKKPSGEIISTSSKRIPISRDNPTGTAILSIAPSSAQTFKFFYKVSLSVPRKVITTGEIENEAGSSELTVPSDVERIWSTRKIYIKGMDEVPVSGGDLEVSYTNLDGTEASRIFPLETERTLPWQTKHLVDRKIIKLQECDCTKPATYRIVATGEGNLYETKDPVKTNRLLVQVGATLVPDFLAKGAVGALGFQPGMNSKQLYNPYDSESLDQETRQVVLEAKSKK